MLQKVLFFLPVRSRYETLHVFSEELAAAFQRQGIQVYLCDLATHSFADICSLARQWSPDITACFNGILPDKKRGFLSEYLGLAHLSLLVDPPYEFLPLKDDPYGIIACVEASSCRLFKDLGAQQTLHFLHAVDPDLSYLPEAKRSIDVVLLGTFLDYRELEQCWNQLPSSLRHLLYRSAERVLGDECSTCLDILCEELELPLSAIWTEIEGYPLRQLWVQLETYVRGRDRFELVHAIQDCQLHLYGDHWEKAFSQVPSHVTLHAPVSYSEALEVLKMSKIALNSVPVFKHGSHERLFVGPCCGAAVLSNATAFIQEHFEEGKSILTYPCANKGEVNTQIRSLLDDEEKRQELVTTAENTIRANHSWDQRVQQLCRIR